jgi:hypothetical protein
MEPTFTTAPELLAVLEELKQLEPIFHHPEFGTTRGAYENMTDAGFSEVGASGRRYSREFVFHLYLAAGTPRHAPRDPVAENQSRVADSLSPGHDGGIFRLSFWLHGNARTAKYLQDIRR